MIKKGEALLFDGSKLTRSSINFVIRWDSSVGQRRGGRRSTMAAPS
jgi:hypothetical protein